MEFLDCGGREGVEGTSSKVCFLLMRLRGKRDMMTMVELLYVSERRWGVVRGQWLCCCMRWKGKGTGGPGGGVGYSRTMPLPQLLYDQHILAYWYSG